MLMLRFFIIHLDPTSSISKFLSDNMQIKRYFSIIGKKKKLVIKTSTIL